MAPNGDARQGRALSLAIRLLRRARVRQFLRRFAPALYLRIIHHEVLAREPELGLLPLLCDASRVSVDVGALWGEFAREMARHSLRCLMFEPNPVMATFLERHVAGSRIKLFQVALSDEVGTSTLRIPNQTPGHASIEPSNPLTNEIYESREVRTATLDSICDERVGFVKIDAEGHEIRVVAGMRELISRDHPVLLIEMADAYNGGQSDSLLTLLNGFGYEAHVFVGGKLDRVESVAAGERLLQQDTGPVTRASNFIFCSDAQAQNINLRVTH